MKLEMRDNCFLGKNADGSDVFEYKNDGHMLKEIVGFKMIGWTCLGPNADNETIARAIGHLQSLLKKPKQGAQS